LNSALGACCVSVGVVNSALPMVTSIESSPDFF
jgi:hypothetical protein